MISTTTTKMNRKRERREIVIVVLDGIRASEDNEGVAPLRWAMRVVVNPKDYLLVLTIINPTAYMPSPNVGFCCMGDQQQQSLPCEGEESIKFLHHQISQRKETYLQILRPYYERCKSNGVKFQVKVAAGFRPKEIVIEEANNAKASWIIMDRCFAYENNLRSSRSDCSIALVNNKEEVEVYDHPHQSNGSETSTVVEVEQPNPIAPEFLQESVSQENSLEGERLVNMRRGSENLLTIKRSIEESERADTISPNYSSGQNKRKGKIFEQGNTSRGSENRFTIKADTISPNYSSGQNKRKGEIGEISEGGKRSNDFERVDGRSKISLHDNISLGRFSEAMVVLRIPFKLSWQEIIQITGGFQSGGCITQYQNFEMYDGFFNNPYYPVNVKRFIGGDSNGIVEVEKRVSSTLFHRNIFGLVGYHESENGTALVYTRATKGTLDRYLYDLRGKQVGLTFQTRMKIAIEIGRGVRYMHEECPRGPVVHGNLKPCNIFLGRHFEPLIAGFERSTWLQFEQVVTDDAYKRCCNKDPSQHESMELVKSDVFSFGVLLLRLFCKRCLPEDDKHVIEWARPLLLRGAFYELLDQDMEDLDMYEMYKVMCVATQCTKTRPLSRPSMTQVVSMLRGENSCIMELSPSSDDSV